MQTSGTKQTYNFKYDQLEIQNAKYINKYMKYKLFISICGSACNLYQAEVFFCSVQLYTASSYIVILIYCLVTHSMQIIPVYDPKRTMVSVQV